MKVYSQKIKSLAVAIATLYIGFTTVSYGEDPNDNPQLVNAFYNPNVKEQSVLFRFLHERLLIETLANLIEANDLCDYCEMRENFSLTFPEGSPDFLKELDISEDTSLDSREGSSDFLKELDFNEVISAGPRYKTRKNCDLCELLEGFAFKDLRNKLLNKLTELHEEELRELDSEFAEVLKSFLGGFSIESPEDLEEQNALYEKIYNQIEKIGEFPNLSNKIILLKNVAKDVLEFFKEVDRNDDLDPEVKLSLSFANHLAVHKKFLWDNSYTLSQIETIADSGFKIGGDEIETLSEIVSEVDRIQNWVNNNPPSEEKISVKDLL